MSKTKQLALWGGLFAVGIILAIVAAISIPAVREVVQGSGLYLLMTQPAPEGMFLPLGVAHVIMIVICLALLYLGIAKKFEPLLLIPIAIGGLLANVPGAGMTDDGGLLHLLYTMGISTGMFPLLIFLGVGAMIDFGPMLANPKTALLGGAAQLAIFGTFFGALVLSKFLPFFNLTLQQAASVAIIGGADGPTSIFLAGHLSPELLGAVAVAAYSYMALVPVIQPPIMRALTTEKERQIQMVQLREVSQREKIIFPVVGMILTALFIPMAMPLVGMLLFGNLLKESGVTKRLADTAANELINIVTLLLGLAVGSRMSAEMFLTSQTLIVLVLGILAFGLGTAGGVWMAKFINLFLVQKINPLIGSAGVSAVPMAARVSEKLGQESNPENHLLMHAMGANVAGSLGSAIAAGVLLALLG